ncbi:MAG: hypothetical protein ACOYOQ_00205 [Microthrixaceae bacterium]
MRWTARFNDGSTVVVEDDSVVVLGDVAEEYVRPHIEFCLENGWPSLPGWDIDTSPGVDPRWMYLRLLAAGASEVEGPCPVCDEEDEMDYPEDAIVG